MNDLIQELAEQAGYKHPDAVGMIEDYAYFDHEKFAKLIVRECAEFVRYKAEKAMSQEILYVGNDLLTHFGVE